MALIPQKGCDYPDLRYLYRHVVSVIAPVWYDVGIELMDSKDYRDLNVLKNDCNLDLRKRSKEMLNLWLQRRPKASWNDLIEALKRDHIAYNESACVIENMLQREAEEPTNDTGPKAIVPVSIENDPNQEEKLELVEQNQSPKNVSMEEAQKQLSTGKKSEIVQPMLPQVKHLKQKDVGRCIEDSINEPEKLMENISLQDGCDFPFSENNTANSKFFGNSHIPRDVIESTTTENHKISERVCRAVSNFYCGQFKDRWKVETDSSPINVVSALLVERCSELKVVVLTTGITKKKDCSYFMNKCDADDDLDECTWGVCDGHAESVCYRLASFYLVTEIHKYSKDPEKSILACRLGFALKEGIKFHFFTTHPPCGFMAKEKRHCLSWKIPFKGKPHCLKCSSTILIGSYLGIQGSLSHLFYQPIYISSITITKYDDVTSQNADYIKQCFINFQDKLNKASKDTESRYQLFIPDVEIADVQSKDLFKCIKPYNDVKFYEFYHLETEERYNENEIKKVAGAVTGDINFGSHMMVFKLKNGLDKQEVHEKLKLQIENTLSETFFLDELNLLKKRNFEELQKAQVTLSKALNIKEALEKLKSLINEKIKVKYITQSEVTVRLKDIEECKLKMAELTLQVDKLKNSFCAAIEQFKCDPKVQTAKNSSMSLLSESTEQFKTDSQSMIEQIHSLNKSIENFENGTKSIVDELISYKDFKETLDDLDVYLKEVDKSINNSDCLFELELMGCDWARYIKLMQKDVEKCS